MFGEVQTTADDYYAQGGRRCVYPYFFTFETGVKGRWVGKHLVDVFVAEFPYRTREYYIDALRAGRLGIVKKTSSTVQDEKTDSGPVLTQRDRVFHTIHRHERPIWRSPSISVIATDENFIVVDKPPSVPVHTCGRYNKNTVLQILAVEHGLRQLAPCHRLDKCTSGVLVLCRSKGVAIEINELLAKHTTQRDPAIQKKYLALVKGKFYPASSQFAPVVCDYPIRCLDFSKGKFGCVIDPSERAKIQPPLVLPNKKRERGSGEEEEEETKEQRATRLKEKQELVRKMLHRGHTAENALERAKEAETHMWLFSYDSSRDLSVVCCLPRTGRTHQIRLHLAALGYPIVGDCVYGGAIADYSELLEASCEGRSQGEAADNLKPFDAAKLETSAHCKQCQSGCVYGKKYHDCSEDEDEMSDDVACFSIALHAFEYQFSFRSRRHEYRTAPPWWARLPPSK